MFVVVTVTLAQASVIVDEALAHGRRHRLQPLTVAVLDPGGHLVALKREDGSGILRVEVAVGKAWGVLALGLPPVELAARADSSPAFFTAVTALAGGRLLPVPGGMFVRDTGGALLGAVGVSGDVSDHDAACAVAGVRAAGLVPDGADWPE